MSLNKIKMLIGRYYWTPVFFIDEIDCCVSFSSYLLEKAIRLDYDCVNSTTCSII